MANSSNAVAFGFNSKGYIDQLIAFLKEKLNSTEFKMEVLKIFSDEIWESHDSSRAGNPDWIYEAISDAKTWVISDSRAKKNGSILSIEVGLPPRKWFGGIDGYHFRMLLIEYGSGNKSKLRRTPLTYHFAGEESWGTTFDSPYRVGQHDIVRPWQAKKGRSGKEDWQENPTVPGDELPEAMNQRGQPFMENATKRVLDCFELNTALWLEEFAEKYPISAFITAKQK